MSKARAQAVARDAQRLAVQLGIRDPSEQIRWAKKLLDWCKLQPGADVAGLKAAEHVLGLHLEGGEGRAMKKHITKDDGDCVSWCPACGPACKHGENSKECTKCETER